MNTNGYFMILENLHCKYPFWFLASCRSLANNQLNGTVPDLTDVTQLDYV